MSGWPSCETCGLVAVHRRGEPAFTCICHATAEQVAVVEALLDDWHQDVWDEVLRSYSGDGRDAAYDLSGVFVWSDTIQAVIRRRIEARR